MIIGLAINISRLRASEYQCRITVNTEKVKSQIKRKSMLIIHRLSHPQVSI